MHKTGLNDAAQVFFAILLVVFWLMQFFKHITTNRMNGDEKFDLTGWMLSTWRRGSCDCHTRTRPECSCDFQLDTIKSDDVVFLKPKLQVDISWIASAVLTAFDFMALWLKNAGTAPYNKQVGVQKSNSSFVLFVLRSQVEKCLDICL